MKTKEEFEAIHRGEYDGAHKVTGAFRPSSQRDPGIYVERVWVNPGYRQNKRYEVVLSVGAFDITTYETESEVDAMKYARDIADQHSCLSVFSIDKTK